MGAAPPWQGVGCPRCWGWWRRRRWPPRQWRCPGAAPRSPSPPAAPSPGSSQPCPSSPGTRWWSWEYWCGDIEILIFWDVVSLVGPGQVNDRQGIDSSNLAGDIQVLVTISSHSRMDLNRVRGGCNIMYQHVACHHTGDTHCRPRPPSAGSPRPQSWRPCTGRFQRSAGLPGPRAAPGAACRCRCAPRRPGPDSPGTCRLSPGDPSSCWAPTGTP